MFDRHTGPIDCKASLSMCAVDECPRKGWYKRQKTRAKITIILIFFFHSVWVFFARGILVATKSEPCQTQAYLKLFYYYFVNLLRLVFFVVDCRQSPFEWVSSRIRNLHNISRTCYILFMVGSCDDLIAFRTFFTSEFVRSPDCRYLITLLALIPIHLYI